MILEERVKELEYIIKLLQTRVASLEISSMVYARPMDSGHWSGHWSGQSKHCPKCGIHLEGVMSYSCTQVNCPTGLGPLTS